MFLQKDDVKYYFYSSGTGEKVKQFHLSTRTLLIGFLGCLLLGFLLKIIIFHQPSSVYDRRLDPQLIEYVYVSPSARRLPKKGQVLCWVMTATNYHDTRALAVNETWLHRCDHGQLFTNSHFKQQNIPYSTVFAGIPDRYENLFYKSRYAFYYIWKHVSQQFDWYMKADDDTYVIVENLRAYLSTLNASEPYYVGYRLKPYLDHGYNAGGAGYIFSNAAMRIFAEQLYDNETACPDDIYEDVGIARCLASASIYPLDTRNPAGQQRFNTFRPEQAMNNDVHESPYWLYDTPSLTGVAAVGADLISFHHLSPDELRLFEVLIYKVRLPAAPLPNSPL